MNNKYIPQYVIGHPVTVNNKQAIVIDRQCTAEAWIYKIKFPGNNYDNIVHFHSDNFNHMPPNCS